MKTPIEKITISALRTHKLQIANAKMALEMMAKPFLGWLRNWRSIRALKAHILKMEITTPAVRTQVQEICNCESTMIGFKDAWVCMTCDRTETLHTN